MRTTLASFAPIVLLFSTFVAASPVRHATRYVETCSPALSAPVRSHITYDEDPTMGWVPQLSKVDTLQQVVVESPSATSLPELAYWNITAASDGTYRIALENSSCLGAYGGQVSQANCDSTCGQAQYMLICQACTGTGGSGCVFRSIYAGLCATATGPGGTLTATGCGDTGTEEASAQSFSFGA